MNDEHLNPTPSPNNGETPEVTSPIFAEMDAVITSTTGEGAPMVSETNIFEMGRAREIELTMAPTESSKSTPIAPQPIIGSSPSVRHDPISPRPPIGQATTSPVPSPSSMSPRSDVGRGVIPPTATSTPTTTPVRDFSAPIPTPPISSSAPISTPAPTPSAPPITNTIPAPPINTVNPAPQISNTPPTPPTQRVEPTPAPPQQPIYHQPVMNQQPPQNYQGAPVPPQPVPVQQAPTPPWGQNRPTPPLMNYQNQAPQMPPQQNAYGVQPQMPLYQNPGYQTFQVTPPIMGMDPRILADIKNRNDKAFGLGIGSIVCAALSIVIGSFLGMLILSVIALVLGLVGINSLPRGQYPNGAPMTANRSKICCIVGAVLGGLSLVFWVFVFLFAVAWY